MTTFDNIIERHQNYSRIKPTIINAATTQLPISIHKNKTNINEVIDNFKQGKTGDCYFLAQLKNLSRRSWGKKVIKDAIKPDNNGGAYVVFKGAIGGEKTFHVSVDEILKNRGTKDKHTYSYGDDDVLVMELAYEKYKKTIGYESIDGRSRSNQVKETTVNNTQHCIEDEVVPLLCGRDTKFTFSHTTYGNDLLLQKTKENIDNYVIEITFEPFNDFGLETDHAYEVIDITTDKKGHPIIILGNPWDSSQRIIKNYYDVISASSHVKVWENPNNHIEGFGDENIKYSHITEEDKQYIDSKQKAYQEAHKKDCNNIMKDPTQTEKTEQSGSGIKISILNNDAEFQKLFETICNPDKNKRIKLLRYLLNDGYKNSEEVSKMVEKRYADIIRMMDNAEYGIGHGQEKAKLIGEFVKYVKQQASSVCVSYSDINEFEEACNKELNAKFYTNEKTIIKAFDKMYEKINKRKDSEPDEMSIKYANLAKKKGYDKLQYIINNFEDGHRVNLLMDYLLDPTNSQEISAMVQKRYSDIIKMIDIAESGWGHGENKKSLMQPLIYFISIQATSAGIPESDISKFIETCDKELSAKFYTNENTIIEAFDEIYRKINNLKTKKRN